MTALLAVALVTGEEAIALGKTALASFDVPAPLRLAGLWRETNPDRPNGWSVSLQSSSLLYTVALTPEGRLRYVEPEPPGGPTPDPVPDPGALRRVEGWLKRFAPRYPTRVLRDPGFPRDDAFFFQALTDGYPVVYPRTRLGYRFTLRDGALRSFTAHEEPIVTGVKEPLLKEEDALAAAKKIFEERENAHLAKGDGTTVSHRLDGNRELGWVLPEEETTARLAWRVPHWSGWRTRRGTKGSLLAIFIDARTGKPIETKYQG